MDVRFLFSQARVGSICLRRRFKGKTWHEWSRALCSTTRCTYNGGSVARSATCTRTFGCVV
eukprot:1196215-Prorocentrum_minimum.AAC.8